MLGLHAIVKKKHSDLVPLNSISLLPLSCFFFSSMVEEIKLHVRRHLSSAYPFFETENALLDHAKVHNGNVSRHEDALSSTHANVKYDVLTSVMRALLKTKGNAKNLDIGWAWMDAPDAMRIGYVICVTVKK